MIRRRKGFRHGRGRRYGTRSLCRYGTQYGGIRRSRSDHHPVRRGCRRVCAVRLCPRTARSRRNHDLHGGAAHQACSRCIYRIGPRSRRRSRSTVHDGALDGNCCPAGFFSAGVSSGSHRAGHAAYRMAAICMPAGRTASPDKHLRSVCRPQKAPKPTINSVMPPGLTPGGMFYSSSLSSSSTVFASPNAPAASSSSRLPYPYRTPTAGSRFWAAPIIS